MVDNIPAFTIKVTVRGRRNSVNILASEVRYSVVPRIILWIRYVLAKSADTITANPSVRSQIETVQMMVMVFPADVLVMEKGRIEDASIITPIQIICRNI